MTFMKSFFLTLLLVASFLTLGVTMLVHYPKAVDAFLNADQPAPGRLVVTGIGSPSASLPTPTSALQGTK